MFPLPRLLSVAAQRRVGEGYTKQLTTLPCAAFAACGILQRASATPPSNTPRSLICMASPTGTQRPPAHALETTPCSPGQVFTKTVRPGVPPHTPHPDALPPPPPPATAEDDRRPLPPPCIIHVSAPRGPPPAAADPSLLAFLVEHAALSPRFVRELAEFGAVWARVGAPHPHISPRPLRISDAAALSRPLAPGAPVYARVHAAPRRHRARWPLALLARYDTAAGPVFFVDKPPGVPVAPGSDNLCECVLAMAPPVVGGPVRITSRLDVGTSGVLALCGTPGAVSLMNAALQGPSCAKTYAVLSRGRPAQGVLRHWVRQDARRGAGVAEVALAREWGDGMPPPGDDGGGWFRAELVVEGCEAVWGGSAWESTVRLVTGRTHQIRVQFAAEGWYVYNDQTYEGTGGQGRIDAGAVLGPYAEQHGLHALRLELTLEDKPVQVTAALPWWRKS